MVRFHERGVTRAWLQYVPTCSVDVNCIPNAFILGLFAAPVEHHLSHRLFHACQNILTICFPPRELFIKFYAKLKIPKLVVA